MPQTTQKPRRTTSRPRTTSGRSFRRKPQQSNLEKAFGMLSSGRSKATPSGKGGKAGAAAMLAAAAGLAFKNRGKLSRRKGGEPSI
jgi:hypothetical protein